jgi:hypothetical protein
MRDNPLEQGWQRFLDRLKELWGKPWEPALASPSNHAPGFAVSF